MTEQEKMRNELQFLTDLFANAISIFAKRNPGNFVGNITLENKIEDEKLLQTVKLDCGELVAEQVDSKAFDDIPTCYNESMGKSSDFACKVE